LRGPQEAIFEKIPAPQFLDDGVLFGRRILVAHKRFVEVGIELLSDRFDWYYPDACESIQYLPVEQLDAFPVLLKPALTVLCVVKTPESAFTSVGHGQEFHQDGDLGKHHGLGLFFVGPLTVIIEFRSLSQESISPLL
jgi:hypothetical protein